MRAEGLGGGWYGGGGSKIRGPVGGRIAGRARIFNIAQRII